MTLSQYDKTYYQKEGKREAYRRGLSEGIPIALGYLAVSFSLGIAARNAGLTIPQAAWSSALNQASAGQYAGYRIIQAAGSLTEIALVTLIANARYSLMSSALAQRLDPEMPFWHRFLLAQNVSDEIFALNIQQPGYLNLYYSYGVWTLPISGWTLGTVLGAIAGNLMPLALISAFSVALYGMFLATIVPAAKTDKVVRGAVAVSFLVSLSATYLPWISELSGGTRIIILTLVISAVTAWFFPIDPKEEVTHD